MIETQPVQKSSLFLPVAAVAFVIIAIFSVYFTIRQSSLESQVEKLTAQKQELTVPAQDKEGEIASVSSMVAIKSQLKKIETDQLMWSKIVEKIENTVPKTKENATPIVQFRSYNGTQDGKVSVSGTTRKGAFDPFGDIVLTIKSLSSDKTFKNIFVPVITKSLTPEGDTVLTFSISFNYQKTTL
ncbi:MAG: hypothetical protein AAB606_04330 [Patescibacteria group bacterium]